MPSTPLVRGRLPGDADWRSGVRCPRVRPSAGHSGRLGTRPHGHNDSCAGSSALLPVGNSHRSASAARACEARPHGNHRGEAPQGAPVRVMDRQSLPMKGLAQPQGGHRVRRFPHQRFTALHLLELSRRTGLTAAGSRADSRSHQACPLCCLKSEDAITCMRTARAVAGVDPLRKPAPTFGRRHPRCVPDARARCLLVSPADIRHGPHARFPGGDVRVISWKDLN
jgi:hypothetical protein